MVLVVKPICSHHGKHAALLDCLSSLRLLELFKITGVYFLFENKSIFSIFDSNLETTTTLQVPSFFIVYNF